MDANIVNLQTLFGTEVSYRIPQFQRPYAWKKDEQWKPLWDDVLKVVGNILHNEDHNIPPHFMGAIVLQQQNSGTGEVAKWIVVDGQQRLTTLQLLIKATQEALQNVDDTERVNRLTELTLNGPSHWGGDPNNETKIGQSNLNDQQAFQESIRGLSDSNRPMRSIGEAHKYFKDEVTLWLNEQPATRSIKAEALEKTLTEKLQLAAIDLDEAEKPHFIFGVLNTRAEPLKQSDHVKNTVMYEANVVDDALKANELWGMFDRDDWWREDTKEGRLSRIHLDRFLNYWVIMQTQKDVTAERVSAEFSTYFESAGQSIDEITAHVRSAGIIYRDMEKAKHPGIETFLQRMKTMEIGVVIPPLLWLYTREVPDEVRKRSVRALESYLVRRMVCGLSSMGLNRLFIELLGKLESGDAIQADQILIDHLSGQTVENRIWPRDSLVTEHLAERPLRGTSGRQKMVLEAIEMNLRTDKTEDIGNIKTLTVEHIMPQSWDRNWPLSEEIADEDKEEARYRRDQAVKNIGNLTLVTNKLNPSLSNAAWSEKRGTLEKHTSLRLNWTLLNEAPDIWDEETIRQRGKILSAMVTGIWPYADKI